ncbi:FAD-binding domain-containing protein [Leucogyrophana mollusca]|uniref:FAD-binding domain-containing protein n=1 Tax=Leucogyrophana mollusca TaxID=85980 RepID=A0ACB8B7Z1_9AGAM|nr:FAD-binding domain-containing protein [Leucogyrophana mollusca]
MKLLAAFSLLVSSKLTLATFPSCRCVYGDKCWPSATQFTQLESKLSQPLIYPRPSGAVCYPTSNPSGNCSGLVDTWTDGNWRADQPGAMEAPNFETYAFKNGTIDACYANVTLGVPCGQGSVPVIGVDARGVADIQAAVQFAVKYDVRLVVKNTGHDYLGRSAARGAFVVWTHNMKNITYNASFVPQGAPSHETYNAITLGAGVQWHEAYAAANAQGRIMVGGASAGGSVGAAGGWVLGGGHSALSPTYGLGVDNVVEMTVVLSTGEYLTVNSHQHPDLFWAMRGGGGGTYGILTSVTYRTYPSLPVQAALFSANATNPTVMNTLMTELMRIHPALSDAGWSGYGSASNSSLFFAYMKPNGTVAQLNESFHSFVVFAQNLTSQGLSIVTKPVYEDTWYEFYSTYLSGGVENGGNTMLGSRLIPRETLEKNSKELTNILLPINLSWNFVAGGKVSKIDPNSAGVNPAWRKAIIHLTFGIAWPFGASSQEIDGMIDILKAKEKALRDLTPESGAYFNEASLYEENWQYTFFGTHYPALKAIKDKYDPHGLFVVAEGVGSEDWDSDLNCRKWW